MLCLGWVVVEAQIPLEPLEPKVPADPNENLTGSTTPCGVDLSVQGGFPPYVYTWSTGATTEDINGVPPGSYTVVVTDALCGQATKTFTVESGYIEVVSIQNPKCSGTSANVGSINIRTKETGCAYRWSNGATTEDITNLGTGTYTVTVSTPSGCSLVRSFSLCCCPSTAQDNTLPTVCSNVPDVSQTQVIIKRKTSASANDGEITVVVPNLNGQVVYYKWSSTYNNAVVSQNITNKMTNLASAVYSVTVTNACGQTFRKTINNLLSCQEMAMKVTGSTPLVCSSPQGVSIVNITVSSSAYTPIKYTWDNGSTGTSATTTIPNRTNLVSNTYYRITASEAGGCSSTAVFNPQSVQVLKIDGTVVNTCQGFNAGSIQATASDAGSWSMAATPPYTYKWSTNTTNQTANDLFKGTYNVTATDARGCTNTKSFTVSDITQYTSEWVGNGCTESIKCNGKQKSLTDYGPPITRPYTCTQTITTCSVNGRYLETNDVGYTYRDLDLEQCRIKKFCGSDGSFAGYEYGYTEFDETICSDCECCDYYACVINGVKMGRSGSPYCYNTCAIIDPIGSNTGFKSTEQALQAFPNPFEQNLTLLWISTQKGDYTIKITDILGRNVFETIVNLQNKEKFEYTLSTEKWAKGIYIVEIRSEQVNWTSQILKQ